MSENISGRHFHFTIGPVQGFVAQARRTRDFWAGSFILSWLSAVAMRAVQKQGGTILFPVPDDGFMAALEGGKAGPKQGNVPNRFQAEVLTGFSPARVEETVRTAWRELAEEVWTADVAGRANPDTRAIWVRQIESFWDLQWALVDDAAASNTVDCMKNWRTHLPPDEPGVKCMMMDGWQELSGAKHPGRRPGDPDGPDAFWQSIRESGMAGMKTDLREGEMLCAIAFVKRRFSRHFVKFAAEMPPGLDGGTWTLKGWNLPNGVPSVHYMAAAPWLAQLLGRASEDTESGLLVRSLLKDFHNSACKLTGELPVEVEPDAVDAFHDSANRRIDEYDELDFNIACVRRAGGQRKWQALDGAVFFDAMLENGKLWADKRDDAMDLLDKLKALRRATDLAPVSPFYAVLLMDGDELGMHMGKVSMQAAITAGLAAFTKGVPVIVEANNGFLIYAGGDDVLAVLPLEDALRCAAALRTHYLTCFDPTVITATLSGAIDYAHIKMPLGKVLRDSHDLLVNVAKEGRGRDAIACRVWKPGGLTVEWAMPWVCALDNNEVIIDQRADDFRKGSSGKEGDMASKFLFRIRERFDLLNPPTTGGDAVLNDDEALSLMAMEYLNSGLIQDKRFGMAEARAKVKSLLDQCRPVIRDKKLNDAAAWPRSQRLEADGALLVRFLALKGVER